jgi:hypothetical protein
MEKESKGTIELMRKSNGGKKDWDEIAKSLERVENLMKRREKASMKYTRFADLGGN